MHRYGIRLCAANLLLCGQSIGQPGQKRERSGRLERFKKGNLKIKLCKYTRQTMRSGDNGKAIIKFDYSN